jgi:hypothetical protein
VDRVVNGIGRASSNNKREAVERTGEGYGIRVVLKSPKLFFRGTRHGCIIALHASSERPSPNAI